MKQRHYTDAQRQKYREATAAYRATPEGHANKLEYERNLRNSAKGKLQRHRWMTETVKGRAYVERQRVLARKRMEKRRRK